MPPNSVLTLTLSAIVWPCYDIDAFHCDRPAVHDSEGLQTQTTTEQRAAHIAQSEAEHTSHHTRTDSEPDDSDIEPIDPVIAIQAFRVQRLNLLPMIGSSLLLVNTLYAKGVITRTILNEITTTLGISEEQKSMTLLNAVEDKMMLDPSAFRTFVTALQSEPALEEMTCQLLCSYRQMKSSTSCATAITTCTGPMARYASYLKACYSTSPISQAYKWPLTPSTKYINLAIIKSRLVSRKEASEFTRLTLHGDIDQLFHKKDPIDIEDVLKPEHGQKLRFVLVEGAPGIGKSTLAWELCRRWDEMEALKQYSLVVLVRLRDKKIQLATSLADFFCYVDTDLQKAVVQEVVARGGEGVLLIMDGADEICPSDIWKDDTSVFHQLLSGSLLPRATVLVTTRPSASTTLVSQWKPQKRIEVLGFLTKHIFQYAESIFGSEQEVLDDFHKYISSSPSIRSMLYIPLNTVIAVGVFRENREKDKPIPTTLTQLYSELTFILLQRYLLDFKIVEPSSLPQTVEELPETVHKGFLELAKVAYEGVIEQKYTFPHLPEGSKALGFTTTSPELHTGRRLSYAFLHLTLQEYFAAYYLSQLPVTQQHEAFIQYDFSPHLTVMWTFVAGLTHFRGIGWETVSPSSGHRVKPSLLHWLYETQTTETIRAVLGSGELFFASEIVHTPFDLFSLGYCLSHSQCTWALNLNHLNQESLEMVILGAKAKPPSAVSSSISTLRFIDSEVQTCLQHLKTLPFSKVRSIFLRGCHLNGPSFSTLVRNIIPIMDSLIILYIEDNPVGNAQGEVSVFLNTLLPNKIQFILVLRGLVLGCDDLSILALLVVPQRRSTALYIDGRNMQEEAVRRMITVVFAESSLQILTIGNINLQSSVPCRDNAVDLLESNTNLKMLLMQNCMNSFVIECARALQKNSALKTFFVQVVDFNLGKDVADALAEMVKLNQSLTELEIRCTYIFGNTLEKERIKALIDALEYNTTLEVVKLPASSKQSTFFDARIQWIQGL